jgi:hypothetical protein
VAAARSRPLQPSSGVSPDTNGPEDRLCLANARASVPWRPVVEKILTHLGLDPQPPPKGRAREAGQDFAARAALAGNTSPQAAPASCSRGELARHGGATPQDSGSTLRWRPRVPLANRQAPAEPEQPEPAGSTSWHFMPSQPGPRASLGHH